MKVALNVSFNKDWAVAELSLLPPDLVNDYNRDFNVGIYPANVQRTLYFNRLYSKDKSITTGTKLMNSVVNFLDNHNFSVILEVNAYHSVDTNRLIRFYEKFGFTMRYCSNHPGGGANAYLMVRQQDFGCTEEKAPF